MGIVVIGTINGRNQVNQSVPRLAASTDTLVELLPESQIRQFHEIGSSLRLTYAPRLLTHESPLTTYLLQTTLEKLSLMNPPLVQQPLIELISDLLVWQAQILPFAGAK